MATISLLSVLYYVATLGPFKFYVTQMGVGGCQIFWRYEGVRFNVISVRRGWVGVQFPEKNVT